MYDQKGLGLQADRPIEAGPQYTQSNCSSIFVAAREIDEKPAVQVKQSQLSHLADIPSRIFRREFRRASGMTPYQYLLKVRAIRAASIVLAEPNADLKEVAERLGFANVGALKRKFKREHRCSIEQYRALNTSKSMINENQDLD